MADTDLRPTLCFSASFPRDPGFASTAGALAVRMATAAGFGEDEALVIGQTVDGAFGTALTAPSANGAAVVDLSLSAGDETFDVGVSCGPTRVLEISRPRPR